MAKLSIYSIKTRVYVVASIAEDLSKVFQEAEKIAEAILSPVESRHKEEPHFVTPPEPARKENNEKLEKKGVKKQSIKACNLSINNYYLTFRGK